jgi:hypothetical protein
MTTITIEDNEEYDIRREMEDIVKIEVMNDSKEVMAFWPSTGIPFEAKIGFKTDETTRQKCLNAFDLKTNQSFIGDDSMNKNSNYYLGIREKNVMKIVSISMYKMNPIINLNNKSLNETLTQTPLTIKEQLDEMKEKFGSRKTQRSLASKRKYAIEFGEDDVNDIQSTNSSTNKSLLETTIGETPPISGNIVDILPKQNRDAISVDSVYQLNDIIYENEQNIIKRLEEELFGAIDNTFILDLIRDSNNSTKKMIAIYINLIIKMLNLKASELRKPDPLPAISDEVKGFLFERFAYTQQLPRNKSRFVISDKEKDRLLIYGIILSLMLFNYRPIDMELLQKSFKVPLRQLRRIVEIIGCYVENTKNISGVNNKCIVLKIPLNTLKESKKRR